MSNCMVTKKIFQMIRNYDSRVAYLERNIYSEIDLNYPWIWFARVGEMWTFEKIDRGRRFWDTQNFTVVPVDETFLMK